MATEDMRLLALETPERPLLSVVVPVYGSEQSLDELHRRLRISLEKITSRWEVVFVDDCSPDGAWRLLEGFSEADPRFRSIQLMRNRGQQRAVLCGLSLAAGEYVVTMDDDLQHRPEEIGRLLTSIESSGADVVVGRYRTKRHGSVRRMATRVVKWLAQRTIGLPPSISLTSFRIMRREVAQAVSGIRHANPVVGYLLYSVTTRFANLEVEHDARAHGTSSYTVRQLIAYFSCMVIDYSDWPLRAVSGSGIVLALGSFAGAAYFLVRWLSGSIGVSGFTTIVILLTSLFGCVLVALGIIGSYLVRILRQSGPDSIATIRSDSGSSRRFAF